MQLADITRLLQSHAPHDWQSELPMTRADELLNRKQPVEMIIMAADIRSSTLLMKEAVDFNQFAKIIGTFVTSVRTILQKRRGWFDKFTGDGFLAYWIVDSRDAAAYFEEVLANANAIIEVFRKDAERQLRENSYNYPSRVGISIGLDAGPVNLAEIAGDVTIVGRPVVGAVRMVSSAEPYETISNVYLGQRFLGSAMALGEKKITMAPAVRKTKEYPSGQQVFMITLPGQT